MKLTAKVGLSFVAVVLVFGLVMVYANYQSVQREKLNAVKMFEERGVSIAKAVDASITSKTELNWNSQMLIDKAMSSGMNIVQFDINAEAAMGASKTGYWKLASSDAHVIQTPSSAADIDVIKNNVHSVSYDTRDGMKIINVTYPLHDENGMAFASAQIQLDMSSVDKMMVPSSTYYYVIAMIGLAILVALYLSYGITRPIKQLTDMANKVSQGDMDAKMPEIKSHDEIGDMAQSFGRMVASVKFLVADDKGA
jgi:HAMP domain-containing protein